MTNSKKKFLTVICVVLATLMIATNVVMLAACTETTNPNNPSVKYYNNEEDPLVFSTLDLDKVFNPFFSTSGTDSSVVGMTQIGMLGNDKEGNPVYGEKEAVVVLDMDKVEAGTGEDLTTTYNFVLKNNVRFSDGTYLTMKDVLFNLYVYLDPAYTGSSTIYSTDIVGLAAYRTQTADKKEQENAMNKFKASAETRILNLVAAIEEIYDDYGTTIDTDEFETYLKAYVTNPTYAHVFEDYEKAMELFEEELNTDYSNSMNSYDSITFKDKDGNLYKDLLTTDVEAFLYNEGLISWNKNDAELTCSFTKFENVKTLTKEQAIKQVFDSKVPNAVDEIVLYWATSVSLNEYLTNLAMEEYYANSGDRLFPNISGIRFSNRFDAVTVNGKTYEAVDGHYNAATQAPEEGYNEVLSITINKVDPKAIWNFAFGVAPLAYYSDAEHIAAFDYESNFGVEYSSQSFMTEVVKNPNKIGVPFGAGPYAASKSSGGIIGTTNITAGDFYDKGVVYFERNPYYIMGQPTIKKVRYQVVSSSQMLTALYNKEIDYAEPSAKPETINELKGKKSDGIGSTSIKTSGYGYIGINAGKVPDIKVRQAIMHAINTQECVNYYGTTAEAIYRSMSKANWAYPQNSTSYYPYIGGKVPANLSVVNPDYAEYVTALGKKAGDTLTEKEQDDFLLKLLSDAGYTAQNSEGVWVSKSGHALKYTFTIAGEETDHPAYSAMFHASEVLNRIGFKITVTTDSNALTKLATGSLTVWAAAWGSTIDPDMYQVYHKDSNATSVLNWGYKQILMNNGGKYDTEYAIVEQLSLLIEQARETNDQDTRKILYSQALDKVMELAVELPTYQRDDLFAYNSLKIDTDTFNKDTSPYKGLTSDIHTISLYVER